MNHGKFIAKQERLAAKRIEQVWPTTDLRILELGCGLGGIARHIKAKQIILSDVNPQRPDVVEIDAQNIGFLDNSFDLVITSNMLEHVPDYREALREMVRVAPRLYLSWTPWLSPFGGHDVAPWHWFGKLPVDNPLGKHLFRTYVGGVLQELEYLGMKYTARPRYWPWLKHLAEWPITQEWATWNVEVIAKR